MVTKDPPMYLLHETHHVWQLTVLNGLPPNVQRRISYLYLDAAMQIHYNFYIAGAVTEEAVLLPRTPVEVVIARICLEAP